MDEEMTVVVISERAGQLLWIMDDQVRRDYVQIDFELGAMFGAHITVDELHTYIEELSKTGTVWEIKNEPGAATEYRIAVSNCEWLIHDSERDSSNDDSA